VRTHTGYFLEKAVLLKTSFDLSSALRKLAASSYRVRNWPKSGLRGSGSPPLDGVSFS
jgi:hypothetical protein